MRWWQGPKLNFGEEGPHVSIRNMGFLSYFGHYVFLVLVGLPFGFPLATSRLIEVTVSVVSMLVCITAIFVISRLENGNNGDNIKSDVDFLLWTKDNPLEPDILEVGNLSALAASHFQRDLPTRILIHGYEDTGTTGWVLTVRNSYFNKGTEYI